MNKQSNQMAVRYKSIADGSNAAFKSEDSLNKILSPGCYAVEIEHTNSNVGLPVDCCSDEHYIVGTLLVTDSGTTGPKQNNRVTGQVLIFSLRPGNETKIFTRTHSAGAWDSWRTLAQTGMYDHISSTDELISTVAGLVEETKRIDSTFSAEISTIEERIEIAFDNKITPITGVSYEIFTGAGTQNSDVNYHFVAGEKYTITAKREQYNTNYTVGISILNRENNKTLKSFSMEGDELETSVEYIPASDADGYVRFYTGYADNSTTLSIVSKSELEKVAETAELVWTDVTDVATLLEGNKFISSAGKPTATAKDIRVFTIDGRVVKKIKAYVAADSAAASFIAFYNSDTMSADTMISNIESKATTMWCEADVPEDCKLIGVTNDYGLLPFPEIFCVADGVKGCLDNKVAIEEKTEKLRALDPQQTLFCSNYLYKNSGVQKTVAYTCYLTEYDNETIKGASISGIIFNVLEPGVLSLYLANNVELDSRTETLVEEINVTQLGVQVIRFSNPIVVGQNQTFGFRNTFTYAISTDYNLAGFVGIRYVYNNRFTATSKDFGFGLIGAKRYVASDKYPVTRGILGSSFFRTNHYYDHLFIDKINKGVANDDIIIPSESIYSVAISKRLGFDVLELNVNNTSDGAFLVFHGNGGKFGSQFQHIDGVTDISAVAVNSVTLEWVKSNVRYKSKYAKYRTAPSTLEEMLYECKRNGIIPFVQRKDVVVNNAWVYSTTIADRIMGEGNYISYGGGSKRITSAPIYYYGTEDNINSILAVCNKFGAPFIYGINGVEKFTDDELKNIVDTLHNKGHFVGFVGSYQNEPLNQKLLNMGFDISASGWNVPLFTDSNLVCADEFSQFTHNGAVNDNELTLSAGNTLSIEHSGNVPFLSVGLLQIRFTGKLKIKMGDYINDNFESDGVSAITLTTYYMEKAPVFSITAVEGTTVKEILFKASKR